MAGGSDSSDGSDIFWPGYVDATTNLILNLLFLLTILMVAVFMFALELGRSSKIQALEPAEVATKPGVEAASETTDETLEENRQLKREIERLNQLLAQQSIQKTQSGGMEKTAEATASIAKPQSGLDEMMASDFEVVVRFTDQSVTLTPEEHERLLELLKPTLNGEKTSIYVEVPAGFSESKRMGFYRAMTVRNLLIEMNMPGDAIDVSVVEGSSNANASLVRVRSR